MKLTDYKSFIELFPTGNSGYKVKKQIWETTLDKATLNEIFSEEPYIELTKDNIRKEKNLKMFIIKTLMWGYPTKGRGNNIDNLLLESEFIKLLSILEKYKKDKKISFNQLIEDYKKYKIKGLGISTLSKFLHLLEIKINGFEAIILDDRIISILNENDFEELSDFKNNINRDSALKLETQNINYLKYLEVINNTAKNLDTKAENIEMFLFFFGKNLY